MSLVEFVVLCQLHLQKSLSIRLGDLAKQTVANANF